MPCHEYVRAWPCVSSHMPHYFSLAVVSKPINRVFLRIEIDETERHSAKTLSSRSALCAAGSDHPGPRRVAFRFRFARMLQYYLLSRAPSPGPRHAEGQEQLRRAWQARDGRL